jgi:hypothetical protein
MAPLAFLPKLLLTVLGAIGAAAVALIAADRPGGFWGIHPWAVYAAVADVVLASTIVPVFEAVRWRLRLGAIGVWLRVSVAIAGTLGSGIIALVGVNLPHGYWSSHSLLIWIGAVAAASAALLAPAFEAWQTRLHARLASLTRDVEVILSGARETILDWTRLPHRSVSIRAYVPGVRWKRRQVPELVLLGEEPRRFRTALKGIRLIEHRGVIGESWATMSTLGVDLATLRQRAVIMTADAWNRQPASERGWLTHSEATRLGHGCVVVVPTPNASGRLECCVVLEGPEGSIERLLEPSIRAFLTETGRMVSIMASTRG